MREGMSTSIFLDIFNGNLVPVVERCVSFLLRHPVEKCLLIGNTLPKSGWYSLKEPREPLVVGICFFEKLMEIVPIRGDELTRVLCALPVQINKLQVQTQLRSLTIKY
jgi:hypothetical protein